MITGATISNIKSTLYINSPSHPSELCILTSLSMYQRFNKRCRRVITCEGLTKWPVNTETQPIPSQAQSQTQFHLLRPHADHGLSGYCKTRDNPAPSPRQGHARHQYSQTQYNQRPFQHHPQHRCSFAASAPSLPFPSVFLSLFSYLQQQHHLQWQG